MAKLVGEQKSDLKRLRWAGATCICNDSSLVLEALLFRASLELSQLTTNRFGVASLAKANAVVASPRELFTGAKIASKPQYLLDRGERLLQRTAPRRRTFKTQLQALSDFLSRSGDGVLEALNFSYRDVMSAELLLMSSPINMAPPRLLLRIRYTGTMPYCHGCAAHLHRSGWLACSSMRVSFQVTRYLSFQKAQLPRTCNMLTARTRYCTPASYEVGSYETSTGDGHNAPDDE